MVNEILLQWVKYVARDYPPEGLHWKQAAVCLQTFHAAAIEAEMCDNCQALAQDVDPPDSEFHHRELQTSES